MGMFDYVTVDQALLPLVDGKKVRHDGFQTKDGPCILTTYNVTAEGISYVDFKYGWDPELESGLYTIGWTTKKGALTHENETLVVLEQDDSIHFYDSHHDFIAYYKDGKVVVDLVTR